MKTNLEKWNHYKEIINKRIEDFVNSVFGDEKPKEYYRVSTAVETRTVTSFGYDFEKERNALYFSGKRPSNEKINAIKDLAERDINFEKDKIFLHWESFDGKWKSSSADLYSKILPESGLFFDRVEAERVALERKVKRDRDNSLLDAGTHFRCGYCGKVTPKNEEVLRTIINFKMYGYAGKQKRYCSGQCGFHDQCAHEG
jgi:hypothetical protein